ncbi:MAG: hypothetical protein KAU06_02145 [Candidatus Marinimicrobia bacterium]|nr:hypothetical protein [Candidatus Neomarinimicrobiota bacterium]
MKTTHLIIVVCLVFALFSCDSKIKNIKQSSSETDTTEIADGGTLVIGVRSEPESLNPLTALSQTSRNIISLVFRRLADINEDLTTFTPQLAKNWVFSSDSMNLTFHLRTDVLWHDNKPFTAADVVYSYQLQINPDVAWDGISYKDNIASVQSPDDSTVVFSFHKKSLSMLMDAIEGYIVPKHILKHDPPEKMHESTFNRHPVGTGPFRFLGWKDQQTVTLIKNSFYYEIGKPHLDRIIFKIVPDNLNLLTQLKSGEVNLVEGIYPKDFQGIVKSWDDDKSSVKPVSYMGRRYDFIGWNLIDPDTYQEALQNESTEITINEYIKPNKLFGSQKVRSALTMAIDREALTSAVNFGMALPMNGPAPPILAAYNEDANIHWLYDPRQARKLLSEEGWIDTDKDGILDKDGVAFEFEMVTESGNVRWEQVATIIQDQLGKIGIRVTPRLVEPALLYGKMLPSKDFDAVVIGWVVGLTMDLAPLFHSSSFLTPFHFTGYYSPRYDSLDYASKNTLDPETAQKYYNNIASLLSYDLPYTWLYYRLECSAIHRRFKNVKSDKRGMYINLEDWWIPLNERSRIDKLFEG